MIDRSARRRSRSPGGALWRDASACRAARTGRREFRRAVLPAASFSFGAAFLATGGFSSRRVHHVNPPKSYPALSNGVATRSILIPVDTEIYGSAPLLPEEFVKPLRLPRQPNPEIGMSGMFHETVVSRSRETIVGLPVDPSSFSATFVVYFVGCRCTTVSLPPVLQEEPRTVSSSPVRIARLRFLRGSIGILRAV